MEPLWPLSSKTFHKTFLLQRLTESKTRLIASTALVLGKERRGTFSNDYFFLFCSKLSQSSGHNPLPSLGTGSKRLYQSGTSEDTYIIPLMLINEAIAHNF